MKGKLQLNHHVYMHAFCFNLFFLYTTHIQTYMSSATQLVITWMPPPYCCLHQCEDYARCELLNKCHYICAHEDDEKDY
jgi:hypothetical protein